MKGSVADGLDQRLSPCDLATAHRSRRGAVDSGEEAINRRTLALAAYTGPSERRPQFERELS